MTAKSGTGKRNVSFQAHRLECLNIKNLLVFIADSQSGLFEYFPLN